MDSYNQKKLNMELYPIVSLFLVGCCCVIHFFYNFLSKIKLFNFYMLYYKCDVICFEISDKPFFDTSFGEQWL
jgi:hypothetical protein